MYIRKYQIKLFNRRRRKEIFKILKQKEYDRFQEQFEQFEFPNCMDINNEKKLYWYCETCGWHKFKTENNKIKCEMCGDEGDVISEIAYSSFEEDYSIRCSQCGNFVDREDAEGLKGIYYNDDEEIWLCVSCVKHEFF